MAVVGRMPNDTDLTIFLEAGYAGLNFAFVGGVGRNVNGGSAVPVHAFQFACCDGRFKGHGVAFMGSAQNAVIGGNFRRGGRNLRLREGWQERNKGECKQQGGGFHERLLFGHSRAGNCGRQRGSAEQSVKRKRNFQRQVE